MLIRCKYEIIDRLNEPLNCFTFLYSQIEPIYTRISNHFYNDSGYRHRLDKLSVNYFNYFQKRTDIDGIEKIANELYPINNEEEFNLYCLSLLKALHEYLSHNHKIRFKSFKAEISCNNIVLWVKPANPIYDVVPRKLRESFGTTINDLFGKSNILIAKQQNHPYVPVNSTDSRRLNSFLAKKIDSFKIAITPFMSSMAIQFNSHSHIGIANKTPFWAENINNKEDSKQVLLEILNSCFDKNVTILVLPELMVDDYLLDTIKNWLSDKNRKSVQKEGKGLCVVVAGSFHINDLSKKNKRYNRSCILNYNGEILWEHDKLQRYEVNCDDLRESPHLKKILKLSDNGGHEGIFAGDKLYYIDTPIGRIVVCICIDFFHSNLQELLSNSHATIFLVPAMSHQNYHIIEAARGFGDSNKASTFVSNSGCFAKKESSHIHIDGASFYYLPSKEKLINIKYAVNVNEIERTLIFDMAKIIKWEDKRAAR